MLCPLLRWCLCSGPLGAHRGLLQQGGYCQQATAHSCGVCRSAEGRCPSTSGPGTTTDQGADPVLTQGPQHSAVADQDLRGRIVLQGDAGETGSGVWLGASAGSCWGWGCVVWPAAGRGCDSGWRNRCVQAVLLFLVGCATTTRLLIADIADSRCNMRELLPRLGTPYQDESPPCGSSTSGLLHPRCNTLLGGHPWSVASSFCASSG